MMEKLYDRKTDYAVHPGKVLSRFLEDKNMTQRDLAIRTGRPNKTISNIINGKESVTPDTAIQFEKVLGINAQYWLNLEALYKEDVARIKEEKQLSQLTDWINDFPVKEMAKFGWIQDIADPITSVKEILKFFGVAGKNEWESVWYRPNAAYRKSKVFQSNPYAVAAWLRKGIIEAQKIETEPFDKRLFKEVLTEIRGLTRSNPEDFEPKLKRLCANSGVIVELIPELQRTRLYGATKWIGNRALIQLSLRRKREDIFWFTFFHEAGHILMHGKSDVFIDSETGYEDSQEKEREADDFARDFLIPMKRWENFKNNQLFDISNIRIFAKSIDITPAIVIGRLQKEGYIRYNSRLNTYIKSYYLK